MLLLHRLRTLALGVAITWSLAASAPTPATPTPTRAPLDLKIGLIAGTSAAPIIVPSEDGQFAARGLNVSLEAIPDSAQGLISTSTAQFQLAYVTMGAAALNAFNRGVDLKIIAAGSAQPAGHGDNTPLVVRSQLIDSGQVRTVADLKGRKVAINVRGSTPDYKLAKALATGGLTIDDVDIQLVPIADTVVALSTGAVDAGLLLQPFGAQAVARGVGTILLDDYDPLGQGGLVVANSAFLDQHPEAVTRFLEVYVEAIRRLSKGKIKADDPALAALQRYTNVAPEVIRLGPDPYWPTDGRVQVDSLRDQQAFFMRTGITDYAQPLQFERLIDYGPLDAAFKNIGG